MNPLASVFDEEEELARRVEDVLNDSLNHLNGTYESLCKRHIQQFMQGAELYARLVIYFCVHIIVIIIEVVYMYTVHGI